MTDGKVVHLKLVNGDEILGCVVDISEQNIITLETPLHIIEHVDPRTQSTVVLLQQYMILDKIQLISLQSNHIIAQATVEPEIEEYYFNTIEYQKLTSSNKIFEGIAGINKRMKQMIDEELITQQEGIKNFKEPLKVVDNLIYLPVTVSSNTVH